MSVFLSICCLSVYLSICLSIYLSIYLSICLSTFPSVCLSIRLFFRLYVCLSMSLFVCLPVYPSVCLTFCPFVLLSIFFSFCGWSYRSGLCNYRTNSELWLVRLSLSFLCWFTAVHTLLIITNYPWQNTRNNWAGRCFKAAQYWCWKGRGVQ